uniref:Uncharacterized protein n=1 Tax=Podoviridae sp. ctnCN2 TaxID=2825274 RepID=A0A8S5PKD9_9CAUD|nr:MAG TPA: hypothetical protein [Podoviridae sp. ctnCN2]
MAALQRWGAFSWAECGGRDRVLAAPGCRERTGRLVATWAT